MLHPPAPKDTIIRTSSTIQKGGLLRVTAWNRTLKSRFFFFCPIVISIIILPSNLYLYSIHRDPLKTRYESKSIDLTNAINSIPIFQLYQDAKYAWDKLQLRKDAYGLNKTDFFYSTEVIENVNATITNNLGYLPIYYSMYKITNDSNYLALARNMISNIMKYSLGQLEMNNNTYDFVVSYNWSSDNIIDNYFSPVGLFVPIASDDSFFVPIFENLLQNSHEVFWSPQNLIYERRAKDGTIVGDNCHLTWGTSTSRKIIQLLWMAHLTGNTTYKDWADETIEAVWSYSSSYGLLPRSIHSLSGNVKDSTISHYDMAGWLCMLELAYFLNNRSTLAGTGIHTYYNLINAAATGIADYLWTSRQRWGYKTTYFLGVPSNDIAEMNAIYVDYAMLLAYEITKNEDFLTKAIIDFENEFMGTDPVKPTGVLMSKSLIIHSPSTLSTQCQFTGSSNSMVSRTASLIYQYTRNVSFLQKAKYHYNTLMATHRFTKGYTNMLNTGNMQPYPLYNGKPAQVFDLAPIEAILALPSSFLPSENVPIDWGYGLTTTMPAGYGMPGAYTGISIDIEQRKVNLKSVTSDSNGSLFTNFANDSVIESVIIDTNTPYYAFNSNTLSCDEGTHAYTITFTEPSDTNSTLITNTIPTSTPSSSISTSTSSTSLPSSTTETTTTTTVSTVSTSSSTTEVSTDQTTGFLMSIIPIYFLLMLIIKRKRQK